MTHRPDDGSQQELVPDDDAIIGRAVRFSLIALCGLALAAGAGYWFFRSSEEVAPEVEIAATAPVAVRNEAITPRVTFSDVTEAAGIDFVHTNGATGNKLLPETMGSGAAFFDYDGDADQDLYLANGATWDRNRSGEKSPGRLYRNTGGLFEDVTATSGLAHTFYGTGVAVGDIDGDGKLDLFVAAVGPNRLFRNLGGAGFVDITDEARVGGENNAWSTSSSFFDIDNDGDLDLFVCNYVQWSPEIDQEVDYHLTGIGKAYGPPVNYQGSFSYLYRNDGNGSFTDISESSGIQVRNEVTGVAVGKALALGPVDIDGDGWVDLFVANDTVRNFLFRNLGNGVFEEVGELFGVAYGRNGEATGAMGVDSSHFRNDQDLGFAIGNFANEMTSLYTSQGDPTLFADEAIGEGIGAPSRTALSFGILFFDYDLDGRLDMLQTNGHLENDIQVVDASQSYAQPAQLFWNAGNEHRQGFVAVPTADLGDLGADAVGRGSATADIDGDGDLDIVITQTGRPPVLIRNDLDNGHHWLRVELRGPANSIGARLLLTAGDLVQRRQVMPTRSYQSQSELIVTFGLGFHSQVDSLVARWLDGTEVEVENPAIDSLLVLDHPQ